MNFMPQTTFSKSLSDTGMALLSVLTCIVALLLTWRLWQFTVRPVLRPHEPKELPYWIPYLGHGLGFFVDYHCAIAKGLKYFKNVREPFAMNVAGETIYIVCAAPHVAAVWRNSSTISLDPISMRMYTWIGVSKENREKLFIPHEKAKYNEGNQRALTPTQMMIELHHRQVHPGPRFDQHFEKKTLPALFDNLDLTTKEHPAVVEKSDSSVTVSLLKLCMQVFIKGQTDALWGQAIWKVEPELLNLFMTWEHTNWKYLFHLPWFLSQDMLNAKDKLVDAFTKYLCIPPAERRDAGYFAQASESMLREVGLSEREIGGIIMLHYWAIIGNVYKIGFWIIAYLVHNPNRLSIIQKEVASAMTGDSLDEKLLAERCPALDSLFNETLRSTVTSGLGRVVTAPTTIGDKVLQPGRTVMIPFRELHYNSEAWGPSVTQFNAQRFETEPKLLRNPNFRPWGGGSTMCPGRFLAKRLVYAFIGVLLSRYEVHLDESSASFPKGDSTKPSPGVTPLAEGEDVLLRIVSRGKLS